MNTDHLTTIPPFLQRKHQPVSLPKNSTPPPHPGSRLRMPDSRKIYQELAEKRRERERKREKKLELQQARLEKKVLKRQDQESVCRCLEAGAETWGQIAGSLNIPVSRLRSALRALVKRGTVVKLSAKRYGIK